ITLCPVSTLHRPEELRSQLLSDPGSHKSVTFISLISSAPKVRVKGSLPMEKGSTVLRQ
ncbi:hypothetical protein LEMLEM_LOCUS14007, partial [Lemmus lemmus]